MTDLEQLKQELYAKIQATTKPEQPPSDLNLLKSSELPTYQAHQSLRRQTFQQWQQAPAQGAIPSPQSDGWQKEFIYDALSIALPSLQAAHDVAKHLKATHNELYTATCDALNACNAALERINDAP